MDWQLVSNWATLSRQLVNSAQQMTWLPAGLDVLLLWPHLVILVMALCWRRLMHLKQSQWFSPIFLIALRTLTSIEQQLLGLG